MLSLRVRLRDANDTSYNRERSFTGNTYLETICTISLPLDSDDIPLISYIDNKPCHH
jgi:hypothetical protein